MSTDELLRGLNRSQRDAVSSPAQTLAILAGPGSGKTHTLTSRTAWLLQHERLQPSNIIVATFTVKAAAEMKERIGKLIGNGMESRLILGTFHSIACRYLRKYGNLIGLEKGFGIADTSDSTAIIRRIIKRHNLNIEPKVARSRISKRKARGDEKEQVSVPNTVESREFETCYDEYEATLERSKQLDFDDLLLRCVDLLRRFPSCVSNVEAVLIDEFQDTNLVQFDLMRLFASARKRVTIVGDPDQSIYGFRSAETKNFNRMLRQYPETVTIPLEENYRSSACILLAALEVIQQEEGRIAKSLLPTHSSGTQPVLRAHATAWNEAQWLVQEIKRVLGLTGELMDLNDIAILLRSASLSRLIESALGKSGIAYTMVGGLKFYDRMEVKLVLDYLTVINNPESNDAISRVLNVPSRKLGDVTVKALLEEADIGKTSLWKLILDCAQGRKSTKTRLTKPAERGLESFVDLVLTAQQKLNDTVTAGPKELIEHVIRKLSLEDYIRRNYEDDFEARWANVEELLNQAAEYSQNSDSQDDDFLPKLEDLEQTDLSTPLSKFLANIALASAVDVAESDSEPKPQVTISTIHAAKGLEWPLVFIPSAYHGSIPHSRAEDHDEERRLLYVAMTRAQALLYMSWPTKNSRGDKTSLSSFLTASSLKSCLIKRGPSLLQSSAVESIAHILKRACPSRLSIENGMKDLERYEDIVRSDSDDEDQEGIQEDEEDWDGKPRYTRGQRPPKRQRVADFGQKHHIDPLAPPHQTADFDTTIGSSLNGFNGGFVTAGSHYRVLTESSINTAVEKEKGKFNEKTTEPTTKNALTKSRSTTSKSMGAQGTLTNFFKPAGGAKTDTSTDTPVKALPRQSLRPAFAGPRIGVNAANKQRVEDSIHSSLAGHRLRNLPAPTRPKKVTTVLKEGPDSSSYPFLSSSPTRGNEEALHSGDGNQSETVVEHLPGSRTSKTSHVLARPITQGMNMNVGFAPTFHTTTVQSTTMSSATTIGLQTTMSALASEPQQRKSLGVRRSLVGWTNKSGSGFKPPFS